MDEIRKRLVPGVRVLVRQGKWSGAEGTYLGMARIETFPYDPDDEVWHRAVVMRDNGMRIWVQRMFLQVVPKVRTDWSGMNLLERSLRSSGAVA